MLRLASGVLSVPLVMSMLEDFFVPSYTLIKLCYTKKIKAWAGLNDKTHLTTQHHPVKTWEKKVAVLFSTYRVEEDEEIEEYVSNRRTR